uniref:Uncharacterized protein n=1 Tax=Megaselia scalaris TaxID=36166 RepID=T1GV95_MEGSC
GTRKPIGDPNSDFVLVINYKWIYNHWADDQSGSCASDLRKYLSRILKGIDAPGSACKGSYRQKDDNTNPRKM